MSGLYDQTETGIVPVLLCGGSGTRLWPLSRKSYPKQFAQLTGQESLFQQSARRLSGQGIDAPIVVTGDPFRFIVMEQLSAMSIAPKEVLIEPEGRNTAPAVLAAAQWLSQSQPDALMLVAPSDHVVTDETAFRETVHGAAGAARDGKIVLFGIEPTRPETGYGYLEVSDLDETPYVLSRFIEKPDQDKAQRLLASGNTLWNAGIFLFSVKTILDAFAVHAPKLVAAMTPAIENARRDLSFVRIDEDAWAGVPDISIDYAIMEKSQDLVAMPYSGGWSDLGGWSAVWTESDPDESGVVATGEATAIDCSDTLLRSESDGVELVGIGLDDIVAVAMPDAVLVAKKSETQRVKEAVDALKKKGASQAVQSARDHRPWGWFESLVVGERFQVKRIVVNPGAALSLQSHHHRAEHWIVVAGTAKVTIDETERLVSENQSVYIPLGAVHRMENPGKVPMVLIEVQTGSYLGEDDIIRYEDVYSRG